MSYIVVKKNILIFNKKYVIIYIENKERINTMDRYPFYFEATYADDVTGDVHEGGFIIAADYPDAMQQIVAIYEPGLIDIKLECLDDCALFFSLDKARKIRDIMEDTNA